MADLIGTQIAGYRIESLIARGGMGEVYLATQSFPERKVALKLLPHDLSSDPAFRERFIRESNAAASLEHPNIVPVYGAGESDGELWIGMRYVDGEDLRRLLERDGPLSPDRAASICAQVADALEEAHEHGLVHRDVKPGNILIGKGDRAYLTDFGLIRPLELETSLTKTGQLMGTVDYVAPEQVKGQAADGRTDVYSLGCVLYECLTGEPPFRRETEVATLYAHLEDPAPVPSANVDSVSRAMDQVVARAMAKVPGDRFATAAEFGTAIRGAAHVEVIATGRPLPERRSRRRVFAGAVGAVVVVAVVAVLALATDRGTEAPRPPAAAAGPPLNSVIQVDTESGKILSTVPGFGSAGLSLPSVEFGEGAVWVLVGNNVTHVDPATERIVGTTSFGSAFSPSESLAVWSRTVWIGAAPGIARINPATDQALRSVRLEGGSDTVTYVAGRGPSLWAANGDRLTRIDGLGRRVGSADIGQDSSGISAGLDAVWIVDDLQGTLTQVDPDTMKVVATAPVAGDIDAIAVGAGRVWIVDSTAGVVTPFDPNTLTAESPVRVGEHPTDVAIGVGAVWVTDQGDGTISRIDPVTHAVEQIHIGAPVAAIAVDEGSHSLWVAIAESRAGGA